MRGAVAILAAMASAPAMAEARFDMRPADALAAIRRNVDRLEAIAPLPSPKCGPRGLATYCNATISQAVRFQIVETPRSQSGAAIAAFFNGEVGSVYDVSVSYDPTRGEPRDGAVADALCVAALLTFRPKLSPAAARRIYETAMRRAANATATGRGGIGRSFDRTGPGSFMVEAEQLNIRCVMAARDQRDDF